MSREIKKAAEPKRKENILGDTKNKDDVWHDDDDVSFWNGC